MLSLKAKEIFKTIASIAIIILLSIFNFTWAQDSNIDKKDLLSYSFNQTGAQFIEANINFNSKILDKFISEEEMEHLGQQLKEELGIVGSLGDENHFFEMDGSIEESKYYKQFSKDDENSSQLMISGKDNEERIVTIILYTFYDKYESIEETDLYIDVIQEKNLDINNVTEKIEKTYSKFNKNAEITSCITGAFEGQLEHNEKIKKITEILQLTNGKRVEGLIDPSIISISAYSPDIDSFIFTGNNKMNLNIAMRDNEYEGKTYIWIGTPIIATGY